MDTWPLRWTHTQRSKFSSWKCATALFSRRSAGSAAILIPVEYADMAALKFCFRANSLPFSSNHTGLRSSGVRSSSQKPDIMTQNTDKSWEALFQLQKMFFHTDILFHSILFENPFLFGCLLRLALWCDKATLAKIDFDGSVISDRWDLRGFFRYRQRSLWWFWFMFDLHFFLRQCWNL